MTIKEHLQNMTPAQINLVDAAFAVSLFAKTKEWPEPMSPEFDEFAHLLNDLENAFKSNGIDMSVAARNALEAI